LTAKLNSDYVLVMNAITSALTSVGLVFAAFVTLAILVAGFFLGRKWFNKIDGGTGERIYNVGAGPLTASDYKDLRSSGWTPKEISVGTKTTY